LRAGDFMQSIYNPQVEQVSVAIYDGEAKPENLLYESANTPRRRARFVTSTTLDISGRKWTLQFRSLPSFEAYSGLELVPAVLFLGTIINATLFLLVRSGLSLREERAEILE